MSSDLRQLRELRRKGKAPAMPVFVGRGRNFLEQNVRDIGCAYVYVGQDWRKYDWSALSGLYVICDLPLIPESVEVLRAIKSARPRRLEAFVDGELSVVFPPFNEQGEAL